MTDMTVRDHKKILRNSYKKLALHMLLNASFSAFFLRLLNASFIAFLVRFESIKLTGLLANFWPHLYPLLYPPVSLIKPPFSLFLLFFFCLSGRVPNSIVSSKVE